MTSTVRAETDAEWVEMRMVEVKGVLSYLQKWTATVIEGQEDLAKNAIANTEKLRYQSETFGLMLRRITETLEGETPEEKPDLPQDAQTALHHAKTMMRAVDKVIENHDGYRLVQRLLDIEETLEGDAMVAAWACINVTRGSVEFDQATMWWE